MWQVCFRVRSGASYFHLFHLDTDHSPSIDGTLIDHGQNCQSGGR